MVDYIIAALAPRFNFHPYTQDDIKQSAWEFAIEGLEGFNPEFRGKNNITLEDRVKGYLYVHVNRRLMNLHRKVIGRCKARVTVTCPISIDSVADDGESLLFVSPDEFYVNVDSNEIKETLDIHIPGTMRSDYNKLLSKTPIPKKRRDAVLSEVKRIVRTYLPSYFEGDDG